MLQTDLSRPACAAEAAPQAIGPLAVLPGKRLLLVSTQAQALCERLLQWRLQVVIAGSAQAALEVLAADPQAYDFLLVDGDLPDRGGAELVAMLAEPAYVLVRPALAVLLAPPGWRCATALPAYAQLLSSPLGDQDLLNSLSRPPVVDVVHHAASVPRLSILLVEGSRWHEQLASRLLYQLGHQLVVVETGEEALQVFDGMRFDLVLMDRQLPEQDGWQTTQRIRQMEVATRRRRVPIVLMSANDSAADVPGVDGVVGRPFDHAQFGATLAKVFAVEPLIDMAALQALRTASSPLVLSRALDRFGGDKALLVEIIGLFLDDFPVQLAGLEAGVADMDMQQIRIAAHGLKGTCGSLSAVALPKLAGLMEEAAKVGDVASVTLIQPVLREALLAFEAALRFAVADIDAALSGLPGALP